MRVLYYIILIFLVIVAALSLFASFIPFKIIKPLIDSLDSDGKVEFFTLGFHYTIIFKLRLCSFFMGLISVLLYVCRRHFINYLSQLRFRESYGDFKNAFISHLNRLCQNNKYELLTFAIIFLVGIVLRFYYLFTPIRMDEAGIFMYLASKPFLVCLVSYPFPGHHVFYTLMVNVLHNLLGDAVWVMRLPALLSGILLIPASYLLFRKVSDNTTALLSSTLIATSSPLIEYSTNARGYSTISFIFILILLLAYYLSTHRNTFGWCLFIIFSALGLYTVPVFLLPLGIAIIWYLFLIVSNKSDYIFLKDLAFSGFLIICLTFILYLPIILVSGYKSVVSNKYVVSQSFSFFLSELAGMFTSTWDFWNRDIPTVIMFLIAFGFLLFILRIKYASNASRLLLISSILWIFILLIVKRINPQYRIWLFLVPVYFGLACTGLSYIVHKISRQPLHLSIIISVIFLVGISANIISINSIYNSDTGGQLLVDGEEITQYIKYNMRLQKDKVFVVNLTYRSPLMYYFRKYHLPQDHLFSYKSAQDINIMNNLDKLLVVEVEPDPRENRVRVLKDAGINLNDFQSPVLLRKFDVSSLYVYQKK